MSGLRLFNCPSHRLLGALMALVGFAMFAGQPATASAHDLSGRWSGHWASHKTPHHGPLSSKFRRVDEGHYRVTFTGRFFRVIPFRYGVKMNIVCEGPQSVVLAGSSKLLGFGEFRYHAVINGNSFVANYQSKKDCGEFVLRRDCQ